MSAKLLITLLIVIALISNSFGDDIAKRLVKRYKSGKEKCYDKRKNERPAYECSGIMIRGVNPKLKLAWNMKEMNKHKKAFSLAYLRHDQVFSRFPGDYKSGFIIYPHMNTPRKKNKYKMYCSFPLDGWTDYRDGHGCGISQQFKDPSTNHCRRQNIKSFDKWKSHFKKIVEKHTRRQCGFDLTRKSAAKYFAISIAAKNTSRVVRDILNMLLGIMNLECIRGMKRSLKIYQSRRFFICLALQLENVMRKNIKINFILVVAVQYLL